ncbi:MAG: efflux RND transporter permease subunit [Pseudomonadota bacterium]
MTEPNDRTPRGWLAYFVAHRTAANLLLVLMVAGGAIAATKIRAQFFPDVVLEGVNVNIAWPGAGAEDVDDGIISILAPVLLSVDGVESSSSAAREGNAHVSLEFEPGWDMAQALDDVKAAVDRIDNLPENAEDPTIYKTAFRDRVTDVVIFGPVGIDLLARFGDELQVRLFREGVTRTTVLGVPEPVLRVAAPEQALIRHDLTLQQIADAIAAETSSDPAGQVASGASRVRAGNDRRSVQAIGDIAVRSRTDGSKLHVRDVATVEVEGIERGRAYFHGDAPAVVLQVQRNAGGDAIVLQSTVQRVVEEMNAELPVAVSMRLTRTRAEAISARLDILQDNAAWGLGLVLLVLFLFLSARTAFWVAAGIPVALAATVGLMFAFGITLNMVSMFALIICLGIVVDDAIVVGEHADFLHRSGLPPADAAAAAARRMGPPVCSAALTTIIAFASLTAIGGRFGDLIADVPFTVCVVLLASLAECFLVLPAHMRHALQARRPEAWYEWPSRTMDRGFQWFRHRAFVPAMERLLRTRYPNIAAALMLLMLSLALFFDGSVRWRFFNAPERGTISANIAMLPGSERADTVAMLDEMRRALDVVATRYEQQHGRSPVEFSMATVGGGVGRGLRGVHGKDVELLGGFSIELLDPDLRPYSAFAFIADWQREIRKSSRLELLALRGGRSGPGGDAIDVQLLGTDAERLKRAAEELKAALDGMPAVSALEDTLAYDKTELTLTLTPRGEALGFTTAALGRELHRRLEGIDAAEFPQGQRTATITVSLPRDELGADFLYRTQVRAPEGGYLALEEVVEITPRVGFSSVLRENGLRTLRVTGDVSEDDPAAAEAVTSALTGQLLPELAARYGFDWQLRGLHEQSRRFLDGALTGLAVGLLGIFLVLAWIFASWTRPLVVMVVIPLGLIGTVWGHYWHGIPLSMFTVVGFIGMAGIIINDSIVLVTTIDQHARRRPLREAVLQAVSERLRPVFLTTATTVLGLTPLLFEQSRQAQFLLPTVITLVYGLGFGMFLVLVITPSLVLIQRDIGMSLRAARRLLAALARGKLRGARV